MQKLLKLMMMIFVAGVAFWALKTWFVVNFIGNMFWSSSVLVQTVMTILPILIVVGAGYAVKCIIRLNPSDVRNRSGSAAIFLSIAIAASGCSAAHSNVQTLVTNDCGVTWKVIKVGETIPTLVAVCSYKVTIPDYPMQGDVKFKTSFANRVLADINVSYDYMIVDPMKFVGEAKYLGKMNSGTDDDSNKSSAYESAENSVIDKRIREIASTHLMQQDIVDFSQGEFEDMLLVETNKILEEKGVKLNFLSFVPIPEEQTRLAIDVLTAMKVYKSKNLGALGQQIIIAKSGAAKISLSNDGPPPAKE
jgi:hypothetical protein